MIKNILITGGAGYIGSHVSEVLIKNKKKIFIIDNLSTGYRRLINKKAKFFKVDILKSKKVREIIVKNNIDSVIHLAASLIIEEGEKYPKKYFKNNVLGTKNLLESCENTGVKNLVFSSTAAVYKDGQYKVHENSIIKPKSVYGKTKIKAEKIIKQFCKRNKINYCILRYFNIAGSSPSGKIGLINKSDHLFKNFSREIIKKRPILKIYGDNYDTKDGSCIRDFIHVSDISDIHVLTADSLLKQPTSDIYNCGYGQGYSIKEVINEMENIIKSKLKVEIGPRRESDIVVSVANSDKFVKKFNWKPKFNNLNYILKTALEWEKIN